MAKAEMEDNYCEPCGECRWCKQNHANRKAVKGLRAKVARLEKRLAEARATQLGAR